MPPAVSHSSAVLQTGRVMREPPCCKRTQILRWLAFSAWSGLSERWVASGAGRAALFVFVAVAGIAWASNAEAATAAMWWKRILVIACPFASLWSCGAESPPAQINKHQACQQMGINESRDLAVLLY